MDDSDLDDSEEFKMSETVDNNYNAKNVVKDKLKPECSDHSKAEYSEITKLTNSNNRDSQSTDERLSLIIDIPV